MLRRLIEQDANGAHKSFGQQPVSIGTRIAIRRRQPQRSGPWLLLTDGKETEPRSKVSFECDKAPRIGCSRDPGNTWEGLGTKPRHGQAGARTPRLVAYFPFIAATNLTKRLGDSQVHIRGGSIRNRLFVLGDALSGQSRPWKGHSRYGTLDYAGQWRLNDDSGRVLMVPPRFCLDLNDTK